MKTTLIGIWLSIFLLLFACDKVVEKPAEDTFPKIVLKEIEQGTDSNGVAAIDVVTENGISDIVSVSFSSPSKGKIEPDVAHHRFIYRAFAEESGLDSFKYVITKASLQPKEGWIRLQINLPACRHKYSHYIDYSIGHQILDTALFIPLDTRDTFCKKSPYYFEITDENSAFYISSQRKDGFFVKMKGSVVQIGNLGINYKIVVPGDTNPYLKLVKFSLDYTQTYCDKIFRVRNWLPFLRPQNHNNNFIIIDRKMFLNQVNCCQSDVVHLKNWFVPVGNVHYNYELDSTRVRVNKNPGPGPEDIKFGYRFANTRHKLDTGFATIRF